MGKKKVTTLVLRLQDMGQETDTCIWEHRELYPSRNPVEVTATPGLAVEPAPSQTFPPSSGDSGFKHCLATTIPDSQQISKHASKSFPVIQKHAGSHRAGLRVACTSVRSTPASGGRPAGCCPSELPGSAGVADIPLGDKARRLLACARGKPYLKERKRNICLPNHI